jgi:uncharacterized membrane protein
MKISKQVFFLIFFCVFTTSIEAQLYIKNSSNKIIRVCLGWYKDNGGYYITRGWYDIEPGQKIDPHLNFTSSEDIFYFYAETKDKKRIWDGDYKFLISSEPFSIEYADKAETKEQNPKYYLVSFIKQEMDFGLFDSWTYTLDFPNDDNLGPNISGTYEYENEFSSGSAIIHDLGNNQFTFEIIIGTIKGCTGEISGTATIIVGGLGEYSDDNCQKLTFIFEEKELTIYENECSYLHGSSCGFSGDYIKK